MNLCRRSALALALALALYTLLAAASVQPAAAHDGASSPEETRQEFWLPAVFVDYQNLVVDPKDREGSRDFYRSVYLASEDVPHAWSMVVIAAGPFQMGCDSSKVPATGTKSAHCDPERVLH